MLYMLDTDTSSYIIKRHPLSVLETLQTKVEAGHDLVISSITYAELMLGAERSGNKRKHIKLVSEFCERLDSIQAWDKDAAEHFAKLQGLLFSKGIPIGMNDTMIAGHALSLKAVVVTNNQRHFSKVPKLKLENWNST